MNSIEMIKIGPTGEQLPATATDHVAVLLPAHGLMFTSRPVNESEQSQPVLEEACQRIDVAGFHDWRMPELDELQLIIDRTRYSPALNTDYFSGVPNDWLWTTSNCAWEKKDSAGRSASAWLVYANGGYVYNSHRFSDGFALAVRRVGQ